MIKIIDYGLGNLFAFENIYKRLNIDIGFCQTEESLHDATHIILPGVGAFDNAIDMLKQSNMLNKLEELILIKKIPVLGVCVGMQILANRSDEGKLEGLGWIPGEIKSFQNINKNKLPLPHMGWNDVFPAHNQKLFKNLTTNARFYFLHSYYFNCVKSSNIAAISSYGEEFCCSINSDNIFGVQFHPEKSHHFGIELLKNFASL